MLWSRLAILGLQLVGLSPSSPNHLSEAVRTQGELLRLLQQAMTDREMLPLLEELGPDYAFYSRLRSVTESHCTAERILFDRDVTEELGPVAQEFVADSINRQREICKQTFVTRLARQIYRYRENWRGKGPFEQFLRFVDPWLTLDSNMRDFRESLSRNVESFLDWCMKRRNLTSKAHSRFLVHGWLVEGCNAVDRMYGHFIASLEQDPNFQPVLTHDAQHMLITAKIARLMKEPRVSFN